MDRTLILRADVRNALQGVVRYATRTGRYVDEVGDVLETLAIILGLTDSIAWPPLVAGDVIDAEAKDAPTALTLAERIERPQVREYRRVPNE